MPRVTKQQVQAWLETTKLTLQDLDQDLLAHIEAEVLARVSPTYDTTVWTNETNTPDLVRTAIAKLYAAWIYERQYSENVPAGGSSYAIRLTANADMLITGIVDGTIELPGLPSASGGEPVFYPTDQSSLLDPTIGDDTSLGPAKFSMGAIF